MAYLQGVIATRDRELEQRTEEIRQEGRSRMAASEVTTKGAAMEDKSGRRLLPDELAAFEAAGEDPSKLSDVEMMRRLRELKPETYGHIDAEAMMGVQKEVDEAAQEEGEGRGAGENRP